jgi:hypothetical protein
MFVYEAREGNLSSIEADVALLIVNVRESGQRLPSQRTDERQRIASNLLFAGGERERSSTKKRVGG